MEAYSIEHLNFTYPNRQTQALSDISLSVSEGEFITVCGKSGSGKTTLLRLMKPSLAPQGALGGSMRFFGLPLGGLDLREESAGIGFVLQDPETQAVTDRVWHELAFGLESLGLPTEEIRARVAETASFFGIEAWFHRPVSELSGGQKQLLGLASVMVMQPRVLLLDEPTGQLDPISAGEFLDALKKINSELGTTVLLTEHRLEHALPLSDRALVMEDGRIIAEGTAPEVGKALRESRSGMFIAMPAPMRVWAGVPSGLDCPATVREGRKWLETYTETHALSPIPESRSASLPASAPAIELREVWFRYERGLPDVVKGLSLTVMRGEVFAVVGGNGAGKTTALSLISGMLKPYRGSVKAGGWDVLKIPDAERFGGLFGVLPQNPKALFAEKTLEEDLRGVLRGRGRSADEERRRFRRVIGLCELAPLLQSHPYDLSGGEQQRAALAEILLLNPEILLLDEPTKGLDAHFKQKLGRLLRELREDGVTVFIVSHDIEFCAAFADRCAMFFDGAVVSTGAPRDFFSGKSFYTTAANRMARALLPSAILAEDIIKACSGVEASPPEQQGPPRQNPARSGRAGPPDAGSGRPPEGADGGECMNPAPAGITAIALIAFLLAVPLTVILGAALFGERRYYFTSLLVVLEAMVPFALIFEKRRPAARELVLIAALSAIAVMGRAAFFMLPQFKPALAIIIVTGIAFGGETGFLVGALSAFVSNFFLGQGPWTPWQMFAFGITGFLAGAVFKKGRPNRAALCAFGAVSALLCGAVLNAASVLMVQPHPTPPMLAAAYALGLPFDLVHGAATALFLFFIARPMMEKLERVIIKYKLFGFRRRNPRQHMGGMV